MTLSRYDIGNPKSHAHLQTMIKDSSLFQVILIKDVT